LLRMPGVPLNLFQRFKYAANINAIPGCPAADQGLLDRVMYRWVFDPLDAATHFLPHAVRFPDKPQFAKNCKGWAISLFVSAEAAREVYRSVTGQFPKQRDVRGTHLAMGHVAAAQGIAYQTGHPGHVSFFEYAHVSIGSSFQMVGPL
jgi:hypothetical protein